MLFSAIALVAFMATSMAGEIEETKIVFEIKTESKNTVNKQPIIVISYCSGLFIYVKDYAMQSMSESMAIDIAYAAMKKCQEVTETE